MTAYHYGKYSYLFTILLISSNCNSRFSWCIDSYEYMIIVILNCLRAGEGKNQRKQWTSASYAVHHIITNLIKPEEQRSYFLLSSKTKQRLLSFSSWHSNNARQRNALERHELLIFYIFLFKNKQIPIFRLSQSFVDVILVNVIHACRCASKHEGLSEAFHLGKNPKRFMV